VSDCVFHFAVKPGCDPVQLPNLSAHTALPWVARGYVTVPVECGLFAGEIRVWTTPAHEDVLMSCGGYDEIGHKICECVSKSVSNLKATSFATSRLWL
jgi:hypothetical protein